MVPQLCLPPALRARVVPAVCRFAATIPLLVGVAACAPDQQAPLEPVDIAASSAPAGPLLIVEVSRPDGSGPVKDATVRVYGDRGVNGVGPVATALTNDVGKVNLALPVGNYCVSVRLAPPEWLTLDLVTPPAAFQYTPIGVAYGPVVAVPAQGTSSGTEYDVVPFTPQAFESCYTNLPIRHASGGVVTPVKLAPPIIVTPEILGLNGQPLTGVDVYAVLPVTVPWRTSPDPEIQTAFFSLVDPTASPAEVVVSQGAPFAIEFQQPFAGFNITGTVKGMGGTGPGAFTIEAAPLLCRQFTEQFPAGETDVDFLRANYGYHATLGLQPDLSKVAAQIVHQGAGSVTVTFRTNLPNGQWTTTVGYDCAGGNCGGATVKTTPGKNNQTAQVFHAAKGGGVTKTSIVLGNIPAEHLEVSFAAKTKGDKIPVTSRDVATDAFFLLPKPARCSVQQSNDDKWVVADI